MLISKFDLYNSEWLELVFDDRNKEYGAYDLRQHYAKNMVRAMGITFFCVALLGGASVIFRAAPRERMIPLIVQPPTIPIVPRVEPPAKRIDPPKPLKATPPTRPTATMRDIPPVVVADPLAEKPVVNDKINGAIGPVDSKGPTGPSNVLPADPNSGTGTQPADDKKIYDSGGIDVMPAPVGGETAWAKFLRKNLRFPSEAQDAKVSGRVILSFVIEKDGHLSNIVIERGAGYGFDEEAIRVLKLAKAWTPGQQNGQPVRVKYLIPINFQMSEDER